MLPLSVYGAVAMAHSDVSEEYSSPSQFFFYLYDKRNVSGINVVSITMHPTIFVSRSFLYTNYNELS